MRKRSISNFEISIIKAMLNRGMKNKEIQFYFNRPDRAVNSGRITQISNDSYSDSVNIQMSTDEELDKFIKEFHSNSKSHSLGSLGLTVNSEISSPIDTAIIRNFFEKGADGIWRFKLGETDTHECKENFGFKHAGNWIRAVAALANNRGGYILFGVKDKIPLNQQNNADSYRVVGLSNEEFESADPADFSLKIKSVLDPTPRFHTTLLLVDENKVGVMYVEQHASRPVIATKSDNQIKEGDIFFRYAGQSSRIKYSDLRSMLDERDQQARFEILPMIEKLVTLGPKNSMVADLEKGKLSSSENSILIGDDLIEKIKFIKEGEFDEKTGSPTLKLVGDVHPILSEIKEVIHREIITPNDLINDFLCQVTPDNPEKYIRCAVELGNEAWLPIHYFARKANLSQNEFVDLIKNSNGTQRQKILFSERAKGLQNSFMALGGTPYLINKEMQDAKYPIPQTVKEAANIGRALTVFSEKPTSKLLDLLKLMKDCKNIANTSGKSADSGAVRKGIARLDELFFAEWD